MPNETIEQMRERHEKEILDFQEKCPHNNTHVHEYVYGPMFHGGGYEDWCEDCHKTLAVYKIQQKLIKEGNTSRFEQVGEEARIEMDKFFDWYQEHSEERWF